MSDHKLPCDVRVHSTVITAGVSVSTLQMCIDRHLRHLGDAVSESLKQAARIAELEAAVERLMNGGDALVDGMVCIGAGRLVELQRAEAERDETKASLAATQMAWEDWKVVHSTIRLEAEVERLRKVIERAPHDEGCAYLKPGPLGAKPDGSYFFIMHADSDVTSYPYECDCWKCSALKEET